MRFFELNDSEIVPETRIEKIYLAYSAVPEGTQVSPASLIARLSGEEEEAIFENENAKVVEGVYDGIIDAIEAGGALVSVPMIILDVLEHDNPQ